MADLSGANPNSAVRECVATENDVARVVAREITRLQEASDIPASKIGVLARHRKLRDALLTAEMPVPLVRWEDRDEGKIVCETIHRLKDLERLVIDMIELNEAPDTMTDYIGASRAMLHLVKVSASK